MGTLLYSTFGAWRSVGKLHAIGKRRVHALGDPINIQRQQSPSTYPWRLSNVFYELFGKLRSSTRLTKQRFRTGTRALEYTPVLKQLHFVF